MTTTVTGHCPRVVGFVVPGVGHFDMTTESGLHAYIAATALHGWRTDEEIWCEAPSLRAAIEWRLECRLQ